MTARPTLPQNFSLSPGTLAENFEDYTQWSAYGSGVGTIENDPVNFKNGSNALKITSTDASGYKIAKKTISLDLSNAETFKIWIYAGSPHINNVDIMFSSYALNRVFRKTLTVSRDGWSSFTWLRSEMVNDGGDSWDRIQTTMAIKIYSTAAHGGWLTFDSLVVDNRTATKCIITYDEFRSSIYNTMYPILAPYGYRATGFQILEDIVSWDASTLAKVQELYALGWEFGCHGEVDVTTLTSEQITALYQSTLVALAERDLDRGSNHFAYPGGSFDEASALALADAGCFTSRTLINARQEVPTGNLQMLCGQCTYNTTTLATAKGWIDSAINYGSTIILVFHNLVETPSTTIDWSISDFTELMKYIYSRRIPVITIDEWYNGLTNPRYRSLPVTRATV